MEEEDRYYRTGVIKDIMGAELNIGDAVSFMSPDRYHKTLMVGTIKEVSKTEFAMTADLEIDRDIYFLKIITNDKRIYSTRNKDCAKVDQEEFTMYKLRNK